MKAPVLLANGCSMTYGSELFEDPGTKRCLDNQARMRVAWPGVLARELGFASVINLGFPGSSNERIVRTTITWILENGCSGGHPPRDLAVVIGWSAPMRREFHIAGEWRQLIPYHDYSDGPARLLNRVYREVAWNEEESAIRFGTAVIALQGFLRSCGIPYLFFDAITSLRRTNRDASGALDSYVPHIDPTRYLELENDSGDMASQLGIHRAASSAPHPDADGHARWTRILANHVQRGDLFPTLRSPRVPTSEVQYEGIGSTEIRDLKIGLPPHPPANTALARLASSSDRPLDGESTRQAGLFARLKRAWRRDPFIYD